MDLMKHVLRVLDEALHLQEQALAFDVNTPLLGSLPELDSMAAVALITGLENHFGVTFDEADLNADTFATVGSLCRLVQAYVSPP
ncbi:acyl carrier protein [Aquabacterium sp.]|jgi:acyl carrier protein|uniref:acyl carrier protein n=1 Tax=Aquabacterium sp. TaxID=1872578 RepID=UPI002637830E|nr:acyl carrier protein [Aquabacterium sp.]MDD2975939.1 acyl carrier protein [Aquabacterium sp.]